MIKRKKVLSMVMAVSIITGGVNLSVANAEEVNGDNLIVATENANDEEIFTGDVEDITATEGDTWTIETAVKSIQKECTINSITFEFNMDNKTVSVKRCSQYKRGEVNLPSKIKYNGVEFTLTSIKGKGFYDCRNITKIVLPDSVVSIGNEAFSDCFDLENINLPNTLSSIGEYAFNCCYSLKDITIPNNLKSISKSAFGGCTSLTNIVIPDRITTINEGAFAGCTGLTSIVIPDGVTKLYSSVFANCTNLTTIKFSKNLKEIEEKVFKGCTKLENIIIPDTITIVKAYAFCECSNLKSVTFKGDIIEIGKEAFKECSSLEKVNFLGKVKSINRDAFYDCNSLTSIEFPEGFTGIGNGAFGRCRNLKSVILPESLQGIGDYAFTGCTSLTSISLSKNIEYLNKETFYNCKNLESISIPRNIKTIGSDVFFNCYNLKSVWSSESLFKKFKNKFSAASNPVCIESNLYNRVNYTDDVIKIKADNVKCYEKLSDGSEREIQLTNDGTYFVHDPSRSQEGTRYYYYVAEKDGVEYTSPVIRVTVGEEQATHFPDGFNPQGMAVVNNLVYQYVENNGNEFIKLSGTNNNLESIDIPSKVTIGGRDYEVRSIEDWAFSGNENLKTVTTSSNNLYYIGCGAFNECSNLLSITIPGSATTIGNEAFYGCESLLNIDIPEGVNSIGYRSFAECSNLQNVNIPESLTTIEEFAFYECDNANFYVKSEESKNLLISYGISEDKVINR